MTLFMILSNALLTLSQIDSYYSFACAFLSQSWVFSKKIKEEEGKYGGKSYLA
jgi:hypothetical protein